LFPRIPASPEKPVFLDMSNYTDEQQDDPIAQRLHPWLSTRAKGYVQNGMQNANSSADDCCKLQHSRSGCRMSRPFDPSLPAVEE
jgi:hypothetical protein